MLITRVTQADREELTRLFEASVRGAFDRDGITELFPEELLEVIQTQINVLERDLASDGRDEHMLVARVQNADGRSAIAGTLAIGPPTETVRENLAIDPTRVLEIKAVYILPDYQGTGIGSRLLEAGLRELRDRGINDYCLFTGFRQARAFWTRRLGEPTVIVPDYYAPDVPLIIWKRPVPTHFQETGE